MKQPTPDRWHAYMHECAERCRRQLAAAAHARARSPGVTHPGHERPLDWFISVTRRGCTDE